MADVPFKGKIYFPRAARGTSLALELKHLSRSLEANSPFWRSQPNRFEQWSGPCATLQDGLQLRFLAGRGEPPSA